MSSKSSSSLNDGTAGGVSGSVAGYDTSTLTDEELAKKAQEELNMEGEMEEVRTRLITVTVWCEACSLCSLQSELNMHHVCDW